MPLSVLNRADGGGEIPNSGTIPSLTREITPMRGAEWSDVRPIWAPPFTRAEVFPMVRSASRLQANPLAAICPGELSRRH